ncbi:hypothetical protein [Pseudosporangium ferrugineum]|uniref:Uncharacterized protein n=1 Tax=Pseudosporangium ferrugineum TaxID=439699 RepID=A0A2T0RS93_9ACTN|nr:hypothetical protein [Pseudosporangium ferrugineum]PRY24054.1 hypothetical protein CLV70_114187 [Pseudosporangium ferrugineum]
MTHTSGLVGDALAAVEEARLHGYSEGAALAAAVDHLEDATRDQAVIIAGVLATWLALQMRPTYSEDMPAWIEFVSGCMNREQIGGAD